MEQNKNSLIKQFIIEEENSIPKYKVTFIVVNDVRLVYHTNSDKFLETLRSFEGKRFIIEYALHKANKKETESNETKIIRVKLIKK